MPRANRYILPGHIYRLTRRCLSWCAYDEILGRRQRYRLLDIYALLSVLALPDRETLANSHRAAVDTAIEAKRLAREAM